MPNVGLVIERVWANGASLRSTADRICSDYRQGLSFSVFTPNLDHVVELRRIKKFRATYEKARYVTANGFPIFWAGRLRWATAERGTGPDLIIEPLCAECRLSQGYPGPRIAGVLAPALGSETAADKAKRIAESGARQCSIALGASKQELFTASAIALVRGASVVCIGAGLDSWAGVQARTPSRVKAMRTGWMCRLMFDPVRLWRRFLECMLVLPSVLRASGARPRSARRSS